MEKNLTKISSVPRWLLNGPTILFVEKVSLVLLLGRCYARGKLTLSEKVHILVLDNTDHY